MAKTRALPAGTITAIGAALNAANQEQEVDNRPDPARSLFDFANDLTTTQHLFTLKVLASVLTTAVVTSVKTAVVQEQYENTFDRTPSTLDKRSAMDERKRGEMGNKRADEVIINPVHPVQGNSNVWGHTVVMPPLHRAELLDGLRSYTIAEIEARTDDEQFLPQSYRDRLLFLASNDKPFLRAQNAAQTARRARLLAEGILTPEMIIARGQKAAERFAQPLKTFGKEILMTIGSLGAVSNDPVTDAWFERLPYWQQQALIDKVAQKMDEQGTTLLVWSDEADDEGKARDLEFNGRECKDTAEELRKYRIEWHRANAAKLEHEEALVMDARAARKREPIRLVA